MKMYWAGAAALAVIGAATAAFAQGAPQPSARTAVAKVGSTATTPPAAGDSFQVSIGADYSVGKYGATSDTEVWDFPLDVKAQLDRLRLEATLPYDDIKGPGQLVGGVVVATPGAPITRRTGIGDLTLSAAYLLTREAGALPAIEIGGGVKLPTAATGIGTGKTDGTVSANVYKSLSRTLILFGSAGYSWLGSPAAYALKNGVTLSGGLNLRPTPNQNLGVAVAWRQPIAAGLTDQATVSPYFTQKLGRRFGVTLYGLAGLTSDSPRWGGGLRLTVFP